MGNRGLDYQDVVLRSVFNNTGMLPMRCNIYQDLGGLDSPKNTDSLGDTDTPCKLRWL